MDLNQRKLYKSEWESIEIPVSSDEKKILQMITNGFYENDIYINRNESLHQYLKITMNEKMEDYIYILYLKPSIDKLVEQYQLDDFKVNVNSLVRINSTDKVRLEQNSLEYLKKQNLFEFVLMDLCDEYLKTKEIFYYFTFYHLMKNKISINKNVHSFCLYFLNKYEHDFKKYDCIKNAVHIIEKNQYLFKYKDIQLYPHQKQIFNVFNKDHIQPMLMLYIAPTATGKTITPIGLSAKYKIIFVCAARHVGLALAKSAISINKKIAFAFGCETSDDIRLHYFAAKDYTINKKTGGIKKVDNSNGINVEIMICDISSFEIAMYYMLAFHSKEEMILYWDEPTITLDYESNPFHSIIKKNWKINEIPFVVLSSATLPKEYEIQSTILSFQNKFHNAIIKSIISHDCQKSIPIINSQGYAVLPHTFYRSYDSLQECILHCEEYLTLLRYFDLGEIVYFIDFLKRKQIIDDECINTYFETIENINMNNLKIFYLYILKHISRESWNAFIHEYFLLQEKRPILKENIDVDLKGNKIKKSTIKNTNHNHDVGIYLTTKDSYTLTDGPTLYLCDDIHKISKFCIQQSNIPVFIMDELREKILFNNKINEKLVKLEKENESWKEKQDKKLNDTISQSSSKNIHKYNRDCNVDEEKNQQSKIMIEMEKWRKCLKQIHLNDTFIPNKYNHIKKWAENIETKNSFTCDISDSFINDIMLLDVEDDWKILLMMGIGILFPNANTQYSEIMKKLADTQKLFLIIASNDYIYGTNYQFCHGYIGKHFNLTQEKVIQALGRLGRNDIQKNYSARIRDDEIIHKILSFEKNKIEVENMNRLFS
jgi:hypothetical protein